MSEQGKKADRKLRLPLMLLKRGRSEGQDSLLSNSCPARIPLHSVDKALVLPGKRGTDKCSSLPTAPRISTIRALDHVCHGWLEMY
jgi:hypothetical protein